MYCLLQFNPVYLCNIKNYNYTIEPFSLNIQIPGGYYMMLKSTKKLQKENDLLKKAQQELNERVKELQCLYTITSLSAKNAIPKEEFLQKTVEVIPKSWQYPEITCAKIELNGKIIQTKNFKETPWKQSADIYIHKIKKGSVDVFYLEEKPEIYEGPFLKEERALINSIAQNISQYIERKQIESDKKQSEENLRITLNSIGDAVISTDIQGKIKHMNPVAEKLTGWSIEQALDQNIDVVFTIVNAQTGQKVENPVEKVLQKGEIVGLANHTKLLAKNRKEYQIADSGSPIKNSKGETVGVVLVFRDVTEDYRMIEKLKDSEEQYKSLFTSIRDAILVADTDRKITQCNPAFIELFGYNRDEIIGKETSYIYKNLEEFNLMGQKIKENMDNPNFLLPISYKKKDGSVFIGETNVFYLKNSKGEIVGFIGMIRDITEKIKIEKALQQNERRFRKIVEGAPTPIFIQTDKKFSYLNPVACKLFGIDSPDELLGTPVMDRFHPDFQDEIYKRIHKLNIDRKSVSKLFEQKFLRVDGSEVWVETVGEPIHYDGKDGALVFARDISERKKSEEQLLHSHNLMRYIIEHSNSAIAIHDKDLKYIYVSQRYLKEYNVKDTNIIGKHHYDVFPDIPEKWRKVHQQALAGEVLSNERDVFHRADGTTDYTRWECRPWFESDGSVGGIILYTEVITDIIKKELTLEKYSNRLERAEKDANLGSWEFDPVTGESWWSKQMFRMLGFEYSEQVPSFNEYLEHVHPEDRETIEKVLTNLSEGKVSNMNEYRSNPEYGSLRYFAAKAKSIQDKGSKTIKITGTILDITEQKQVELALKESQSRFRILAESAPVGIVISDINQKTLYANNHFTELFGYTLEDMPSVNEWWKLAYPVQKERERIKKSWNDTITGAHKNKVKVPPMEYLVRCKNGENKFIEFRLATNENLNFVIFTDITTRKEAENELKNLQLSLEKEIQSKTKELTERVNELERFHEATIEREFRIKELRDEVELLKKQRTNQ